MLIEVDTSDLEGKIDEKINEILTEIAVKLTNFMKQEAPVSSGRLRQSIQVLAQEPNKIIVGTNLNYAPHVEFGTKPHIPPLPPLKKWARRKLGAEELAYPVRWKIAQEGTEPNPFTRRAINRVKEEY